MYFFTASNPAYHQLTRNLVVSAKRFGIDVDVYVPHKEHISDHFNCIHLEGDVPRIFEFARFGTREFNVVCNYKLRVISHVIRNRDLFPAFYLDGDTSILADPRDWLKKTIPTPVAIQKQVTHEIVRDFYCMGMLYISHGEEWMAGIFEEPFNCEVNDEVRVNQRIRDAAPEIQKQITHLPEKLFVLGCRRPGRHALVYHANFCIGNESKVNKLKGERAWFLD